MEFVAAIYQISFSSQMKWKNFLLYLDFFWQSWCHWDVQKAGQSSGTGSSKTFHLQCGEEEGDCCLSETLWDKFCSVLCLRMYRKRMNEHHTWQDLETPTVIVLLCSRYLTTETGEDHFAMALVKWWMCGTILGYLNSHLNEKFWQTENNTSRCCCKI